MHNPFLFSFQSMNNMQRLSSLIIIMATIIAAVPAAATQIIQTQQAYAENDKGCVMYEAEADFFVLCTLSLQDRDACKEEAELRDGKCVTREKGLKELDKFSIKEGAGK